MTMEREDEGKGAWTMAEREVGWSYSCSGEDGNFRDYFPEPRLRKSNLTNEGNLFHLIAFPKITFLTRNDSNSAPYEEFYFYPRSLQGGRVMAFARDSKEVVDALFPIAEFRLKGCHPQLALACHLHSQQNPPPARLTCRAFGTRSRSIHVIARQHQGLQSHRVTG